MMTNDIIIKGHEIKEIRCDYVDSYTIIASNIHKPIEFGYCEGFRGGRIPNDNRKPERYIINKDATILFWEDGTKTIVKRSKDDEYNKRLGFLTAYFQKHSGLTKNQANKYLANLLDENDLNTIVGKMKAKSLQNN